MVTMLNLMLRPLAWLPLAVLHAIGVPLGWLVYCCSRTYAARLDANLKQSGLATGEAEYERLRNAAIVEAGKGIVELAAIWLLPAPRVARLIREVRNLNTIEAARRSGRGILILTPHLGCFEITGFFFGQMMPLTVLYRPPRLRWLLPLMIKGRRRGRVDLAATDIAGVRRLFKALRAGNAAGMLPDQVPRFGEGTWANFFGRPALTMTLSNRLRQATGCATFMAFAERLPRGAGYCLHIQPLSDAPADELQLNQAVEAMIRLRPEQYLWGYDRYKVPNGAAAPAINAQSAAP